MARPDTLVIRPIGPDDAPEWRRLWRAYLGFYRTELPDEGYAATVARLLSGRDGEFRACWRWWTRRPSGLHISSSTGPAGHLPTPATFRTSSPTRTTAAGGSAGR